jgi:ABC-type branched-subunit amino acid transport system ATPase component
VSAAAPAPRSDRVSAEAPGGDPLSRGAVPALEVRDLRIDFGGVHAVDGTSFSVPTGRVIGLIGPNGAGKSTALKLIAGALRPTSGEILHNGEDIAGKPAWEVARRGLIRTFQLSAEFARLTVIENLLVAAPGQRATTFLGSLRGKRYWRGQQRELIERARQLLDEFGIAAKADEYAGTLSGGQKRLLEISRALMAEPKLLLLDEPLAGVNPTLRLTVEEHLRRLRDEGMTMVMVEHELSAVERCCDSVIVMAQGRVLASGSMEEMRANEEVVDAYLVG